MLSVLKRVGTLNKLTSALQKVSVVTGRKCTPWMQQYINNRTLVTLAASKSYGNFVGRKVSVTVSSLVPGVFARTMTNLVKKRRAKMNKHKLKKRRKLLRMNTKQSRA
jgi:hypothetical protein